MKIKGNCYLQQLFPRFGQLGHRINSCEMHNCQDEREFWGFYSNLLLPSILSIHRCLWFHLQTLLRRKSRSIDCIYSLLTK